MNYMRQPYPGMYGNGYNNGINSMLPSPTPVQYPYGKQELGHGKDLMEIMSVVTKTEPEMSSIYEFLKEVNEERIEEIEK